MFRRHATSRAALQADDSSPPEISSAVTSSFSEAPVSPGTLASIPSSSQMLISPALSTDANHVGLSAKGKALFVEVVSAYDTAAEADSHSASSSYSDVASMPQRLASRLQGHHSLEVAATSASEMESHSQQRSLGYTSLLLQQTESNNNPEIASKQNYGVCHQGAPLPVNSGANDDASQLASRLAYRKLARAKAAAARERAAWARVEQAACEAPLKELPGFSAASSRLSSLPPPPPLPRRPSTGSSSTSSVPRRASSPRSQPRSTSPRNASSNKAAANPSKHAHSTTSDPSKPTQSQQQLRRSGGSEAGSRESPEALDATRKAASARARARRASRGVGVDGRVPSGDLGLFRRTLIGGVGNPSLGSANPNGSRQRCGDVPGSPRAANGGIPSDTPIKRGSARARARVSAASRQQARSTDPKTSPSSSSSSYTSSSSSSSSSPSSSESSASPQAGKKATPAIDGTT